MYSTDRVSRQGVTQTRACTTPRCTTQGRRWPKMKMPEIRKSVRVNRIHVRAYQGCVWLVRSRTGSNSGYTWLYGPASCQPNGTPETEHIFVRKKCAKLGAFFKMCMGHRTGAPRESFTTPWVHHGHFLRYNESNPKAYARDHMGPKSMFPLGFTGKK